MDEIKFAILNLNIRYYQMRIAEDTVRRYDDSNDSDKKIRKVLIEALRMNEKLFDEQNEKVEKLLKNKNISVSEDDIRNEAERYSDSRLNGHDISAFIKGANYILTKIK